MESAAKNEADDCGLELQEFMDAVSRAVREVDVNSMPKSMRQATENMLQLWADKYGLDRPAEYRLKQE